MSFAKYLAVRSIDRTTGTSSTSFQIQLKEAIPSVKKVKLLNFLAPNTLYKIRLNVNDQVVWNRSSTNYHYQIPPGSYSISSLISLIQTGMNSADSNSYAWTYNVDLMTVTVTGTASFSLNWSSNPNASTSCYRELGFNKVDTSSATSITSPNCVSLERPTRLYISINEFFQSGINTNLNFFSFYIPINVASGSMIEYKQKDDFIQEIEFTTPINITTLTVNLYIENNELANLNGEEFEMVLEINCH
jgi:hypothetical protein